MKRSRRQLSTAIGWVAVTALAITIVPGRPTAAQGAANLQLPTLFVLGASTARNNAGGARGWGDELAGILDGSKINVVNRALPGRSSRSFITEGRWDRVREELKRGDFVLIQFGHNDGGAVEGARARGSLPGIGNETKEITAADGGKEVVLTYGGYLRKVIADTEGKGASPILLSLTVRNLWKDGKLERKTGEFGAWAAQIANAQRVPFIDMTNIVGDEYERLGPAKVKELFPLDFVHTGPAGAALNAAAVVTGIKRLKDGTLTRYFSEKGQAVSL